MRLRRLPFRRAAERRDDSEALRLRHRSRKTETAYVGWVRRFILFHGKRHPKEKGAPEIERFLSSLAVEGEVSASTQNQALAAILFLYRDVLGSQLPWMEGIVRARRPERLPVVLTRQEVASRPFGFASEPQVRKSEMDGTVSRCYRLIAWLVGLGPVESAWSSVAGSASEKSPAHASDQLIVQYTPVLSLSDQAREPRRQR